MKSVLNAARTLGVISDWTLSNLTMQKTLYIAEMLYLSRTGSPMFDENFEAWDYGPVVPKLYHKVKMFGAKPVQDIFTDPILPREEARSQALRDAYATTKNMSGGKLVSITHWDGGAWAANYEPNKRGRVITKSEMMKEWNDRIERNRAAI